MQVTESECGLVACTVLMHGLRAGPSLRSLRAKYDIGRDGMSIRQLHHLLRDNGFDPKVLRVIGEGYRQLSTPYVAYWNNSHYVTVERLRPHRVVVIDPASGRRALSHAEFQESFSGVAICASPTSRACKVQNDPTPWRILLPFVKAHPRRLVALMLLSFLTVLSTLAMPRVASAAISSLLGGSDALPQYVLLLGILFAFALIGVVNTLVSVSAAIAMGRDISKGTFAHLLSLPFRYFAVRGRGDLLYRLHATQTLEDFLTVDLARGLSATLLVVCAGGVMVATSPLLGGLVLLEFLAILGGLALARRYTSRLSDLEAQHESAANSVQVDTISTISLVKSTGLEDEVLRAWSESYEQLLGWRRRRSYLDGTVQTVVGFLQSFSPLVFTVAAMAGVAGSPMAAGDALAFQMLSAALFGQVMVIAQLATRIGHASASVRRLDDILSTPPEHTFTENGKTLVGREVAMSGVSYAYGSLSTPVLSDVSVKIEPGSQVAFVGPSGSGKSTIAKVLVGLVAPLSGEVTFDGVRLGAHDKRAFRDQVTYVEQESPLRNGSIRSNIAWGRAHLSDEDIQAAAKKAGIHSDITAMPMGYETQVTQNGANLSGGQRQRIALARALVIEPRIIVLDESTSALDRPVERHVLDSLNRSSATRIIIAHRLETVRDSDKIFVIQNGRVISTGRHEGLLAECKLYSDMYSRERRRDSLTTTGDRID